MSAKADLRRRIAALRTARPGGAIRVPDAFRARLSAGLVVATYAPMANEADPAPLARMAAAHGCRLALPHVTTRDRPLRFLAWAEDGALEPGPFGLRQPPSGAAEFTPDIILAPLLGFDAAGNRLGHGAGYYDRAFVAHPHAWRVGIAWDVQRVDTLVPDPWDVPLHAIATDRDWIVP